MSDIKDENLEIRLKAFVEYIDSVIKQTDEGGYTFSPREDIIRSVGGNFIFNRQYIVPSGLSYHELSLDTLRRLARYLTDCIVQPSAAVPTTLDHLRYWAWTAATAGQVLEKGRTNLRISDFQYTIHLGLFPIRISRSNGNPTLNVILGDNERLALLSGLAVLEGFICNYGNSLTPEGQARTTITETWKPKQNNINNGQPVHKYHDILQIWRQEDAGSCVSQLLTEINNLNRYDMHSLKWKFEDSVDIIDEEISDGTNNFLRVIGKHRDFNLHGQRSTRTLAPVVLTLCCLYIWDLVEEATYEEQREEVIKSIHWNNQTPGDHPLWPSAFYPV